MGHTKPFIKIYNKGKGLDEVIQFKQVPGSDYK